MKNDIQEHYDSIKTFPIYSTIEIAFEPLKVLIFALRALFCIEICITDALLGTFWLDSKP